MRKIIINIFSIYFTITFILSAFATTGVWVKVILFLCGILNYLVTYKNFMHKERNNYLYNTFYVMLSFILLFFLFNNFNYLDEEIMERYIFLTFPITIKSFLMIWAFLAVVLNLSEYLGNKEY